MSTISAVPYYTQIRKKDEEVESPPVCLYLETTNRCNLLCQTCPRTFASTERPADLSLEQVKQIVEQVPNLQQAVLHGIGEPLMNKELPEIIKYLKGRSINVLFNTNASLLDDNRQRALIESGLDQLRVSLDAAEAESYARVRGLRMFNIILKRLADFQKLKTELGVTRPVVSLWLVGLKETIVQLPAFIKLAADLDVNEVYLQRLVYFDDHQGGQGVARPEQSLYNKLQQDEERIIQEAIELASSLGVKLNASGATSPESSLMSSRGDSPWSDCRRPWALMYITANGNVLPCCIAPFVERDYDSLILGNVFKQPLAEVWNGPAYREFRAKLNSPNPHHACSGCGLRWSL
ncbi:MAG TPA: radical SAM protein [Blastocatellia bacterium]|nr:radical SAM protein [Blastocatellia bacterium]